MTKRIDWIDIFKGFTIIAVVIGHSGSPLTPYVYLFHIPAFIFISGYTFNFKKYDGNFWTLVEVKFKRLIIPYLSFAIFFSFLQIILSTFGYSKIIYSDNSKALFNPFWLFNSISSFNYTNSLAGATWFLVMLFSTTVIAYVTLKLQEKFKYNDLILIVYHLILFIVATSFLYPRWPKTHMNYFLDLGFISIFFFISGYLANKYKLFLLLNNNFFTLILVLGLLISKKFTHHQMDFPNRTFDLWFTILISSFCGIALTYSLSRIAEKIFLIKKTLLYIGQRSIVILSLHFSAFKIFFLLLTSINLYKIDQVKFLTPLPNNIYWIPLVIFSLILSLLIEQILAINKFTKILFLGKSYNPPS